MNGKELKFLNVSYQHMNGRLKYCNSVLKNFTCGVTNNKIRK